MASRSWASNSSRPPPNASGPVEPATSRPQSPPRTRPLSWSSDSTHASGLPRWPTVSCSRLGGSATATTTKCCTALAPSTAHIHRIERIHRMTTAAAPRTDHYPTRITGKAVPQPRLDPAVWGYTTGPLCEQELARYDATGYLVLDELLSAKEVETYRAELRRLGEDPALRASERVVLEPDSDRVRSVFEVEKISEVFAALLASPRLTDIARQVLGSEVYVHQSRVNTKPGFGGAEFDWHSD